MKVSLDVVIKSGEDDVDMDYALKTLAGTASTTCLLAGAILNQKVIERRTNANEVRAKLKHSFKSSYGVNFDLVVIDKKLVSRLNVMTKSVFSEVMSHYISEALYIDPGQKSKEANDVINDLSNIEDDLVRRLRNPLLEMHKITKESGYDVELNYKKRGGKELVILLNKKTAINIDETKQQNKQYEIEGVITRFNAMTGNGRLIAKGREDESTISFGFAGEFKHVSESQKRKISENLHYNNGINRDDWSYIKLVVSDIDLISGETIKYAVHQVN